MNEKILSSTVLLNFLRHLNVNAEMNGFLSIFQQLINNGFIKFEYYFKTLQMFLKTVVRFSFIMKFKTLQIIFFTVVIRFCFNGIDKFKS